MDEKKAVTLTKHFIPHLASLHGRLGLWMAADLKGSAVGHWMEAFLAGSKCKCGMCMYVNDYKHQPLHALMPVIFSAAVCDMRWYFFFCQRRVIRLFGGKIIELSAPK